MHTQAPSTGTLTQAPVTATINLMSLTRNTLHGETPRLQVSLENAGERHTVELMPDSGATCSITDHSMVLKWGLPMVAVSPEDYQVTTVTSEGIHIIGKSAIT